MSLTVRERLQALLDGKMIRLDQWGESEKISLGDELKMHDTINLMSPDEKWEIYEEPALELTPDDLGRKVELRGGEASIIIGINAKRGIYRAYSGIWLDKYGRLSPNVDCDYDIIKVFRD